MTVTDAQYKALADRVATLEANLGDYNIGATEGTNNVNRPNGEATIVKSQRQLHVAMDGIVGYETSDGFHKGRLQLLEESVAEIKTRPATTPTPAAVLAAPDVVGVLAALNIHVAQNTLAIGMLPDPASGSQLQIAGARGASILGRSNAGGTDGQNPGEIHSNSIHVCDNDGGIRFLQYGFWGMGGFVRNTLNRAFTVLAMDSQGDVCSSRDPVGEKAPGQNWYLSTNTVEKFVRLCTFKPGWKMQVREATSYAAAETDVIAAAVDAALKARGL